jgi:hypothetical protein
MGVAANPKPAAPAAPPPIESAFPSQLRKDYVTTCSIVYSHGSIIVVTRDEHASTSLYTHPPIIFQKAQINAHHWPMAMLAPLLRFVFGVAAPVWLGRQAALLVCGRRACCPAILIGGNGSKISFYWQRII